VHYDPRWWSFAMAYDEGLVQRIREALEDPAGTAAPSSSTGSPRIPEARQLTPTYRLTWTSRKPCENHSSTSPRRMKAVRGAFSLSNTLSRFLR
jgi:hypothetical protein